MRTYPTHPPPAYGPAILIVHLRSPYTSKIKQNRCQKKSIHLTFVLFYVSYADGFAAETETKLNEIASLNCSSRLLGHD